MNVYIESNFVLEQALQQEQSESCDEIVNLAASGRISLIVPAFSLAEPHESISRKANMRSNLIHELQRQLPELSRSRAYRDVLASFGELTDVLIGSAERERDGLKDTIAKLLRIVEVIPLNGRVLNAGADVQDALRMSGQDAVIFASVEAHLAEKRPHESCFLNRNTRDFDNPDVRERLEKYGCKFFGRFDGLQYIGHRLKA